MSHIEWCYTYQDKQRRRGKFLALNLYLLLTRVNAWPNEGYLRAVTMAYQDMIRLSEQGDGKLCCMHRITG